MQWASAWGVLTLPVCGRPQQHRGSPFLWPVENEMWFPSEERKIHPMIG